MRDLRLAVGCTLLMLVSGALARAEAPASKLEDDLVRATIDVSGGLTVTPSSSSSREDFDFLVGRWRVRHRELDDSSSWIEWEGTSDAREIIDGLGIIENARTAAGGQSHERVMLRLFDPATKLWSLYEADSETATLDWRHPLVGSFDGDVGTFYARKTLHGETHLVRARWDRSDPDRPIRSRAVSRDGGRTWIEHGSTRAHRLVDGEDAQREKLLTIDTTVPIPELRFDRDGEIVLAAAAGSSRHDFDFMSGKWRMHHLKLKERLAGSTEWIPLESTDTNYGPMLDGLGNSDLYEATFDGEPFEGFTLRLFDPATRLWSLYWVASDSGVMDPPVVGSFDGDLGHFFGKDTFRGQEVIVVFRWDFRDKAHPVWCQAFSADQGKTWEWNWINVMYRIE